MTKTHFDYNDANNPYLYTPIQLKFDHAAERGIYVAKCIGIKPDTTTLESLDLDFDQTDPKNFKFFI